MAVAGKPGAERKQINVIDSRKMKNNIELDELVKLLLCCAVEFQVEHFFCAVSCCDCVVLLTDDGVSSNK